MSVVLRYKKLDETGSTILSELARKVGATFDMAFCCWRNVGNFYGMYGQTDEYYNGHLMHNVYRAYYNMEETAIHQNLHTTQCLYNDYSSDGAVTTNGAGIIFTHKNWELARKAFMPYEGWTIDGSNAVTTSGMLGLYSSSTGVFYDTTHSNQAFGHAGNSSAYKTDNGFSQSTCFPDSKHFFAIS